MNELENEINDIMTNAMKDIGDENMKHQKKVVELLEQKIFDADGTPELCEMYGVLQVAEGSDDITEFIKNIPDELRDGLIDATTTETSPCGHTGLMRLLKFGEGTDIYEPLRDIAVQTGIAETCSGIMIRVPMTCTKNDDETDVKHEGVVTCLALENVLSVIVRIKEGEKYICDSEIYDMDTYQVGTGTRKLIDTVYMAHFLPRYLKKNNPLFYKSILSFLEWRTEQENS